MARFEDRASRCLAEAGGGTVDVELPVVRRDGPSFEDDLVGADRLDVSEAYDVLDRAQEVDLGDGQCRAVVHRGRRPLVEAHELVGSLEACEQVVDVVGCCRRFDAARHPVDGVGHQVERLEVLAVPHPRVAGPHPADAVGVDTVLEQPRARVGPRLAAADDRVAGRGFRDVGEFVHGDAPDIRVDGERRRVPRRDRRFEVAGVDDGASNVHLGRRTRERGHEGDIRRLESHEVRHGEEPHLSRRDVVIVHDPAEVLADLHVVGALVQARVEAIAFEAIGAQRARVDAVTRRGLVELHERVGVVPVTARDVPAIHHDHVAVVVRIDQRVDERHARRARPDHEVVGLDRSHDSAPSARFAGQCVRTALSNVMLTVRGGECNRQCLPMGRRGRDLGVLFEVFECAVGTAKRRLGEAHDAGVGQLHIVDSGTARIRSPSSKTLGPEWTTAPARNRSPISLRSHVR